MSLKSLIPIFAAATLLTACTPQKDYKDLTPGEQLDFHLCVMETANSEATVNEARRIVRDKDVSFPAMEEVAVAFGLASRDCAAKFHVNPDTVPIRPQP